MSNQEIYEKFSAYMSEHPKATAAEAGRAIGISVGRYYTAKSKLGDVVRKKKNKFKIKNIKPINLPIQALPANKIAVFVGEADILAAMFNI